MIQRVFYLMRLSDLLDMIIVNNDNNDMVSKNNWINTSPAFLEK